jgi:hypothetical protein
MGTHQQLTPRSYKNNRHTGNHRKVRINRHTGPIKAAQQRSPPKGIMSRQNRTLTALLQPLTPVDLTGLADRAQHAVKLPVVTHATAACGRH